MMNTGTFLCGIPASAWQNLATDEKLSEPETRSVAEEHRTGFDLLGALLKDFYETKPLSRQVSVSGEEWLRFHQILNRLEAVVSAHAFPAASRRQVDQALEKGGFPCLRVGSGYIDFIHDLYVSESDETATSSLTRNITTIFSPNELRDHVLQYRQALKERDCFHQRDHKHRLWFIENRLLRNGLGLIEFTDTLVYDTNKRARLDGRPLWRKIIALIGKSKVDANKECGSKNRFASIQIPEPPDDWRHFGEKKDRGTLIAQRMRTQVEQALSKGKPIDLGAQRHNMAIPILNDYVHKESGSVRTDAPTIYGAGQSGKPFPLRCLNFLPPEWAPDLTVHVGLMSMRHLDIDRYIDRYWFLNTEIQNIGFSEADHQCTTISLALFEELLGVYSGRKLQVHLYHTGYPPAILGFYRALTLTLASGRWPDGCLQVVPRMQRRRGQDEYEVAHGWPRS